MHLLVDFNDMPPSECSAQENEDEGKHVRLLLEMIEVKTGKPGRPPNKPRIIAAEK